MMRGRIGWILLHAPLLLLAGTGRATDNGCEKGQQSGSGGDKCVDCDAGTFNPAAGSGDCVDWKTCPQGQGRTDGTSLSYCTVVL
jgi:hypothetical protein